MAFAKKTASLFSLLQKYNGNSLVIECSSQACLLEYFLQQCSESPQLNHLLQNIKFLKISVRSYLSYFQIEKTSVNLRHFTQLKTLDFSFQETVVITSQGSHCNHLLELALPSSLKKFFLGYETSVKGLKIEILNLEKCYFKFFKISTNYHLNPFTFSTINTQHLEIFYTNPSGFYSYLVGLFSIYFPATVNLSIWRLYSSSIFIKNPIIKSTESLYFGVFFPNLEMIFGNSLPILIENPLKNLKSITLYKKSLNSNVKEDSTFLANIESLFTFLLDKKAFKSSPAKVIIL